MTHKRNTEGLSQTAQQKSELALERTNKAISQMLKSGKTINFHTVAETAGVSIAYLYKHAEIKQRDHLRKQQSSIKELPHKQGASDDSKKTVSTTLKLRLTELDAEVRGLRNHIEVIQGVAWQVPDFEQEIEPLRSENLRLNVELNELRAENSSLKEQVAPKSKVTSLADKRAVQSVASDNIKAQLADLGISLNPTLTKTIESAPEELVLGAIEALKEAITNGNVSWPGGWLNKAIPEGWMPSETHLHVCNHDIFNEWFNLARTQGLVMASMKGDERKLYVFTKDYVKFPFEHMLAEHPLDILRRR